MADSDRIVEMLKAKATLLIQRERELYALRLSRERTTAWLRTLHRLSVEVRLEALGDMCREWAAAMVGLLHFQTVAAFRHDVATGALSLIEGRSHAKLQDRIVLDERARRVVREQRGGVIRRSEGSDTAALAEALDLQSFLWFVFTECEGQEVLLIAGVAAGVAVAQDVFSSDDLVYFTMVARHLEVLFTNTNLIADLATATRNLQELFDHMRQAIVAFDASGSVVRIASREARFLFQRERLEDCSVRDLLYPGAPAYDVDAASFEEWVDLVMNASVENWAKYEAYAPRDVVIERDGQHTVLALEFRPLVRDARIHQLMLLATDVTVERRLESVLRLQKAEHAARVAAMRRLIAGGPQVFLTFVDSARARFDRCDAIIRECQGLLLAGAIDEVFRHVHTVRGEARAFDLVELEDGARSLERELDQLRTEVRAASVLLTEAATATLRSGLQVARSALDRECDVLKAASPAGAAVFDQISVPRSVLRELSKYAEHGPEPLACLVGRLSAVPFGITAAGVIDSAAAWAEFQGNEVTVDAEPKELLIPERLARVLPGVLAHLVRNCIAHGIEGPEERRAAGKRETGTIRIVATELPRGVCIVVEDDGRGLNAERILDCAERDDGMTNESAGAKKKGSPGAAPDPAKLVFLSGVTTRDVPDALAGHGVGLDAVQSELDRVQYGATIASSSGRWTRVTLEPRAPRATE